MLTILVFLPYFT